MSTYDDAVNCLKQMHTIAQSMNSCAYDMDRDTYYAIEDQKRVELDRTIKFMRDEGWIVPYMICVALPISYTLTSLGIKIAEGHAEKKATTQTTYNINAQNSIIGDNAHHNTFNTGYSFDEVIALVEERISSQSEKSEIIDVLRNLQSAIASNRPLEKGALSRISDKLESCSWLSSGVTALVIQYLASLASK